MAEVLARHMEMEGHAVVLVADGEKGIEEFRRQKVDLVLTDLKLPGKSGLEVLQAVKEENPMIPVLVMTAHGTIEAAVKAVKDGAFDFLQKPVDPDHLLIIIGKALEARQLVTENLILKEELSQTKYAKMVGQSRALLEAQEKAKKVAVGTTTVLLLGESGTGKELFARMIHDFSPRKNGPFVAINCAAIPRELLESELFGHERGSFTGATGRKIGKFELADKGTVFLDEIGDMDMGLQAKLLRVLEGDRFMRVGGTSPVKADVRVVAATNKDLHAAVAKHAFRGSVLPAERVPTRHPAATRPPGGYPVARRSFSRDVQPGGEERGPGGLVRSDGGNEAPSVDGEHPRAAELHRAGRHSLRWPRDPPRAHRLARAGAAGRRGRAGGRESPGSQQRGLPSRGGQDDREGPARDWRQQDQGG